jgi:hypothetical protein
MGADAGEQYYRRAEPREIPDCVLAAVVLL